MRVSQAPPLQVLIFRARLCYEARLAFQLVKRVAERGISRTAVNWYICSANLAHAVE